MEEERATVHLDCPGQKAPKVIDIPERGRETGKGSERDPYDIK